MKRAATPPLQQLSAAAATTIETSASMSSRPPYRGGRGFLSERSYSGGRDRFISGDSHFRFVRDSNLGFQQGEMGSFANNTGLYTPPQNPRHPPFSGNYQFRRAPPYIQRHQYRHPRPHTQNQRPPSFDQNQGVRTPQQFRPRSPKPLDYRNWEYARTLPPPNCDRFTVLSYNILADYLALDHQRKLYNHIPQYMLEWAWRKRSIIFELGLWSADIMCFQEVDKFHDLEEALKVRGYNGIWKMRTGIAVDGCAIFWRVSKFKLLHEEYIEFNKLGLRDNVAQICVLEQRSQNNADNSDSPPISSSNLNKVVICNIHVLYNPKRGEIKLGQVRVLLEKAHAVSKIWNNAPIVLCGDFNCTPKSALYNFISEQKLYLSGLDRDKVSGQSSAEIHAPSSRYLNPRTQPTNDSIPFLLRSDARDIDRRPDNSLSDMQKQDCPDSCVENENLLSANHSLPPDSSDSVLNMSDKSCNDLQLQMKGITLHSEVEKESQNGALCDDKNGRETTCCLSQDSFTESSITCAEDDFSVDHVGEKVSELVSPFATKPEEFYVNATERKQMENVDTTSHLNHRSSKDGFDKASENSVNNIILDDSGIHSQTGLLASKNFSPTPACQNSMAGIVVDSSKVVNFEHLVTEFENESTARKMKGGPSWSSTNIDLAVDEKLEILSSDEQDGASVAGTLTEDDCAFLSALHDEKDPFPSKFGQSVSYLEGSDQSREFDSDSQSLVAPQNEGGDDLLPGLNTEPFEVETTTFDRSIWTPVEIETATGNADCTLMEHRLKLRSTYTEVEPVSWQEFLGTRDENGEPLVTSYNRCFLGTVDYIWRSKGLQTVRVLAPIQKHAMQWTPGFPTKKWGSDHIALATELAFIEDMTNNESES